MRSSSRSSNSDLVWAGLLLVDLRWRRGEALPRMGDSKPGMTSFKNIECAPCDSILRRPRRWSLDHFPAPVGRCGEGFRVADGQSAVTPRALLIIAVPS